VSRSLEKQRLAFEANSEDKRSFEELEEHYFLEGEWELLVGIYRHRLQADALQADPRQAAPLSFRLAQIIEERLGDVEQAHDQYKQCASLDPSFRPALEALRRIYRAREQWDLVLQVAELESGCSFRPPERANFHAEIGAVWLDRLDDPTEALTHYQASVGIDPMHREALTGLARTLGRLGRHAPAAEAWEKVVACVEGSERAEPLVALARLLAGPLQNSERAMECYQQAFQHDFRNEQAICALVIDQTAREQWSLLPDLYEQRFDAATGSDSRTTVAIEAGHLHLKRLGDRDAARHWFERAHELRPDDIAVHYSLAELARECDDSDGLLRSLERLIALCGESAPASVLLEAADLLSSRNEGARAVELLTRARDRSGDDSLVLDALSETLADTNRVDELCDVLETQARLAGDEPELQSELYSELGRCQQSDLGDADAARSAYEQAFDANPQSPRAASQLAELLEKTEAWSDLARHLERARIEGPVGERAEFHTSLGQLRLDHQADPAGAIEAFEAALVLVPDLPRARRGLLHAATAAGDPVTPYACPSARSTRNAVALPSTISRPA